MQITPLVCSLVLAILFVAEPGGSASTFSPVAAGGNKININYRLPNETYPEHYDIELKTNIQTGEKAFQGIVKIDIVIVDSTSSIVLHARQIEISKVTIANPSTSESEELSNEYELEREFLTLTRPNNKHFAAGTKWKLNIIYSGKLRDDSRGIFLSKYIDDVGRDRYLATTRFESTNARLAFPCYDEPDKGANFTITINHSPTYTAISNTPVNKALSSAGKTVFLTTARIPTHIVAFVLSDFVYTEGVSNGVTQRVYSRPNATKKHEWALASGMKVAEHLSKYLGVAFMHTQMKHVALPNFFPGTTNNWGLVVYSEKDLLCDKNIPAVFTQTTIAKSVAHEISHQWFGNYVTVKWWSYLWLKEGFATLFTYRALDSAYPEWGIWQLYHSLDYHNALDSDSKNSSEPLTSYVQTPNEINSRYYAVSFGKAASVLHMWNNALTENVFQKGLQSFLIENKYSAADEEQFFTALQTAVEKGNYRIPATISEMMTTWTQQSGYPILTVTRNYEDGTFIVRQETFFKNENMQDNKTWYVPINYAVATNPDFRDTKATHYLLNVNDMKIEDTMIGKKDWLILNKQSTGFYRINYDAENWNLIAEGLIKRPSEIHLRNRAQLLDDAFRLTFSNRLDHAILLKLLSYLKQEDQFAPWSMARDIFRVFNSYLMGDKRYNEFRLFVAEQVTPIYKKLGANEIPGENNYDKYTRSVAINLACSFGVKECLEETNNKIKALVRTNIPVEPNLVASVYCHGLRQSTDEEFNYFYKKLMNSTNDELRFVLIFYLSCSQDINHIKKYIYSSIDESNGLRSNERSTLLGWIFLRGEEGFLACIEFLNEKWNVYARVMSANGISDQLDDDIRAMASYVVNEKQERKLLGLVAKVKTSNYVAATLETDVKKRIANNLKWLKKHGEPIMAWISQYRAGNGKSSVATDAKSSKVI